MRLLPTRYIRGEDLQPLGPPHITPSPLLPAPQLAGLSAIARALDKNGYFDVRARALDEDPTMQLYLGILVAFGAVTVLDQDGSRHFEITGSLAKQFPMVVNRSLELGLPFFDDWNRRSKKTEDRICALELLHHMELQRIEYEKRCGNSVLVWSEIPVAFAVIKALSQKRGDIYLLELNKDWNRYNFIGGKQIPEDRGDYQVTLVREIEEELGVPHARVKLTQLTDRPISGYGLSGHLGVLSHYPCMVYEVAISGEVALRPKDKWFTEQELLDLSRRSDESGLLINPAYLDFLIRVVGLKNIRYSLTDMLEKESLLERIKGLCVRNKEWIIAVLAIIAAIVMVVKAIVK